MERGILPAFVMMLGSVLVAMLMLGSSPLRGQDKQRALPMSGIVLDASRTPVANASVVLIRHAGRTGQNLSQEILAQSTTDAAGRFSLGPVLLNTEAAFPLETQVSWEYAVATNDGRRTVQRVAFTAPRTNYVITSVSAEIQIR